MKKNWGKMNDLPVLHDIKLSDEEKNYLNKAAKSSIQSTEILNVIVMQRVSNHLLRNLVGAMEQPKFIVLRLSSEDIQKAYTIVKTAIKNTIITI